MEYASSFNSSSSVFEFYSSRTSLEIAILSLGKFIFTKSHKSNDHTDNN